MGQRRKVRQARVEKRLAAGLCLDDSDGVECPRSCCGPGTAGGRCAMHYQRLVREGMNRAPEERLSLRMKAMQAGTLAGAAELRRHRRRASA